MKTTWQFWTSSCAVLNTNKLKLIPGQKAGDKFLQKSVGNVKHLCYNNYNAIYEVKKMENEHLDERNMDENAAEEIVIEETGYTPRPAWQVWTARIGLVLFLLVIAMYYINILRGGF